MPLLADTVVLPGVMVRIDVDAELRYRLAYGGLVVYENGRRRVRGRSASYELRSVDRMTRIHRFNRRLRRLGLKPTPPGVSGWGDQLKVAAATALSGLRLIRGRPDPAPRPYNVWTPP